MLDKSLFKRLVRPYGCTLDDGRYLVNNENVKPEFYDSTIIVKNGKQLAYIAEDRRGWFRMTKHMYELCEADRVALIWFIVEYASCELDER